MYEETLGTDWDALDREATLKRAYALGVAETLGQAPEGELDRLKTQFAARYDQSLVELAYDEGRTRGRTPALDESAEAVWSELVIGDTSTVSRGGSVVPPRQADLPTSLDPPALFERGDDALGRLDLPAFLR